MGSSIMSLTLLPYSIIILKKKIEQCSNNYAKFLQIYKITVPKLIKKYFYKKFTSKFLWLFKFL